MVGFAAKAKWKQGWRRLRHKGVCQGTTREDEAFASYWAEINRRLEGEQVERPLARPPRLTDDDGGAACWYAALGPSARFAMAPMVIQSERAFRILGRRHGVGLCFSPMLVDSKLLSGEDPYAEELLLGPPCPEDTPVMAQLAGSDPRRLLAAAQRLAEAGNVCGVDLNMGCPQVCARDGGYGVYLARDDPDAAVAIVRLLAAELSPRLPVSVKMRVVGGVEGTVRLARRMEEAGASLLTIHGRKPEHRDHQGPSDFDAIRAVREAVRLPVLCNGNVRTRADAEAALRYTGCDGVMAAVGLLRNPRLFSQSQQDQQQQDQQQQRPGEAAPVLSPSGTLLDPRVAFGCCLEYLQIAQAHPPPEVRCVRDHLQGICQGLVQADHADCWDMLGNDFITALPQFVELMRAAAARYGVLDAVEADLALPLAERGRPPRTLQEVKRMNRPQEEEDGDGGGLASSSFGAMFGFEDDDDKEEGEVMVGDDHGGGGSVSMTECEYALEVQDPWSRRLLDRRKTVETRAYPLPAELLHARVLLIESPPGGGLAAHGLDRGKAVGMVVFGACTVYETRAAWVADAARHGVDPAAPPEAFGWREGGVIYGWEVVSVEALPEPHEPFPLKEEQRVVRSIFRVAKKELDGR